MRTGIYIWLVATLYAASAQAQTSSLDSSIPYQGDPILTEPITVSESIDGKVYMECNWPLLIEMIRDLEERIAGAMDTDTLYKDYSAREHVGTSIYQDYDCLMLRDSIWALQIELDNALTSPPTVETRSVYQIAQTLAQLHGAVTFDGRNELIAWGFRLGLDSTLQDSILVPFGTYSAFLDTSAADTGSFVFDKTGLTRYTTYYYSAWAENEDGIAGGDTLSFQTLPDLASGLALSASNISSTQADLSMSISDAGGQGPDSVGFCWSDTPFVLATFSGDSAVSNSQTSPYTFSATGLNRYTKYHFTGYADNLAGRAMVQEPDTFRTSPEIPNLTLSWDGAADSLIAMITDLGGDEGLPLPDSTFFRIGNNSNLTGTGTNQATYLSSDSSFSGTGTSLNLLRGATYFAASYASNSAGTGASDTLEITTTVDVLTAESPENVTDSSATLKASFIYNNAPPNTAGILWGSAADLTAATIEEIALASDSSISIAISGLATDSTYYFTAFATNLGGTAWGDTVSFVASEMNCISPTIQGYTYEVIKINGQCWFAENLRTTQYLNGEAIPSGLSNSDWINATSGARTVYGEGGSSQVANLNTYGQLYNWYAVADERGLCPEGWRVPSDNDWTQLVNGFGGAASAAEELKASSSDPEPWDGNNLSGFEAIPGGYRNDNDGLFYRESERAYLWTSSEAGGLGKRWRMDGGSDALVPDDNPKQNGFSVRCIMDSAQVPVVTTLNAAGVGSNGATLQGNVKFNWSTITSTGFKWGLNSDLSDGTEVAGDTLVGDFTFALTGVQLGDEVFYSAFGTNALGTTFGDTLSFIATTCVPVEFDGYSYEVVEIADQCWFAENLRTTKYSNGDIISSNLSNTSWSNTTTGAQSIYDQGTSSEASNLETYGRLYNHYAVTDPRGICPINWHMPSNSEWSTLVNGFGGTSSASNELKASSSDSPGWDGNNLSGFSALAGGYRNNDNGVFDRENERAYFWTSSTSGSMGKRWRLDENSDALVPSDNGMKNGFSVRCIQNSATVPVVSTATYSSGTSTEVTLNGAVGVNTAAHTATGFKWWRVTDPGSVFTATSNSLEGTFSATVNDLVTGTRIFYTAFATNDLGTSYGDTLFYTPEADLCASPTFDGHTYEVVTIGGQCWFAENLRTTAYENGEALAATGAFDLSSEEQGAQAIYNNDSLANYQPYGRLYNGWAVSGANNICPTGWHVPNESDWNEFEIFAGLPSNLVDSTEFRGNHGEGLKALIGSVPAWDGSDSYGFNGVPGGMSFSSLFVQKDSVGAYLSSTPVANDLSIYRLLVTDSAGVARLELPSYFGASIRCLQDTATLPVVITTSAVDRNRFGGEIGAHIEFNWSPITSSGFLLSRQADLSSAADLPLGVSVGAFNATIDSLALGDTLYYTAYATNTLGTSYGDTLSLATTLCESPEFDGYVYAVVEIGGQCWFAENLRSDIYNDGTPIPDGSLGGDWFTTSAGAQVIFNGDSATYYDDYGRLYNGWAMFEPRGICPTGWHVPLASEFAALVNEAGGAVALKSRPNDSPSWDGTNTSGWSGLPSGYRSNLAEWNGEGTNGRFWSASQDGSGTIIYSLQSESDDVLTYSLSRSNGFSIRCLQDEPGAPETSTLAASPVTEMAATLNGNVDFDNWSIVTTTGFKWGYEVDLTDGTDVFGNAVTGSFSADLSGLNANDSVYFVAFVTNGLGTTYGDTLSFKVEIPPCANLASVSYHGYDYRLVEIAQQCWFAENLRSEKYRDGSPIAGGLDDATWSATSEGAQAIANGDSATHFAEYGRLYNWYAVDSAAGLCPTGWHVATDAEYIELTDLHGGENYGSGTKLKSSPADTPPWNGTNTLGWSGLPGGKRGADGSYSGVEFSGYWWSSTPWGADAYRRWLFADFSSTGRSYQDRNEGYSVRCLRDEASAPRLSTEPASFATETEATLNGVLEFSGWKTITATGFKWGYQEDLSDGIEVIGDALSGDFSADLTGLASNGTIYFSAFATNELGTTYGDTLSRCLMQCDPVEFDSYTYETVAIGCQCWFAENLRSDNYADGSPIPGGLDHATWLAANEGAQAIYGNDSVTYLANYGRLYNWYAVDSAAGLCPTGWHVPTDAEFTVLTDFLGGQTVAGEKMKSSSSDSPAWNGTNSSGWSGLPGGTRHGNTANFLDAGSFGYWWSSSPSDNSFSPQAWDRYMWHGNSFVFRNDNPRTTGFSVRCLRDEASAPQVSTMPASTATETTATLKGALDFSGWNTITAAGFKWGYQEDLSDGIEVTGDTLAGEFSADLTGLVSNGTIYFSAFATNELGTTYGDTLSRYLMQCDPVEFDGYTYETVVVGSQCWFAENLRSDNYADGTPIPGGLDDATWSQSTQGAQAIFAADSASYFSDYGRLYNWYAIDHAGGVCPTGWHVPTRPEFEDLENFLGAAGIGGKMKSTATDSPPWDGTNTSGWSGEPGGQRTTAGNFDQVGSRGIWWSSSVLGTTNYFLVLNSSDDAVQWSGMSNRTLGISVRCLQDAD